MKSLVQTKINVQRTHCNSHFFAQKSGIPFTTLCTWTKDTSKFHLSFLISQKMGINRTNVHVIPSPNKICTKNSLQFPFFAKKYATPFTNLIGDEVDVTISNVSDLIRAATGQPFGENWRILEVGNWFMVYNGDLNVVRSPSKRRGGEQDHSMHGSLFRVY